MCKHKEIDKGVDEWLKRTRRKSPFYLYRRVHSDKGWTYFVIWNEGNKTKYGSLEDGMWTRYGINTCTVLNGETKFDLWQGDQINDDIFDQMLKVRHEESDLPIFEVHTLKNLRW